MDLTLLSLISTVFEFEFEVEVIFPLVYILCFCVAFPP